MKNLFTALLFLGLLVNASVVFACDCNCNKTENCKYECIKDCDCGCKEGKECTCKKCSCKCSVFKKLFKKCTCSKNCEYKNIDTKIEE